MSVLCPELAKVPRPVIITVANADDVIVSTNERVPGTKVMLKCFVPTSYSLTGSNLLTCLPSGSWDKPAPKCVSIQNVSPSTISPSAGYTPSDLTLLPYLVGIGLAVTVCLLLAILLCCAAHYWRGNTKKHSNWRKPSQRHTNMFMQDHGHLPLDEIQRDYRWVRPVPSVSTVDYNGRVSHIPRPSWIAMLPRQEEMSAPYI